MFEGRQATAGDRKQKRIQVETVFFCNGERCHVRYCWSEKRRVRCGRVATVLQCTEKFGERAPHNQSGALTSRRLKRHASKSSLYHQSLASAPSVRSTVQPSASKGSASYSASPSHFLAQAWTSPPRCFSKVKSWSLSRCFTW